MIHNFGTELSTHSQLLLTGTINVESRFTQKQMYVTDVTKSQTHADSMMPMCVCQTGVLRSLI